jgi:hypothetical protein
METKKEPVARSTDRVLEALSTLAALLDRSINEVKLLDTDFQSRLGQALQEKEASAQTAQRLETELSDTTAKLEGQFGKRIEELSNEWQEERNRLSAELSKSSQATVHWEAERARLMGELERMSRVQAATQAEAEKAIMAMKAATSAAKNAKGGVGVNSEALNGEIGRVEGLIKEISALIEDPAAELSVVIRKNVERAEMESYLKGIRYVLNGAASK